MSDYHAEARADVNSFYRENGELGMTVLEAFSGVDPLNCFCGWERNCDEYLGYAERFVAALRDHPPYVDLTGNVLVELVRRSFHPSQVVEVRPGFCFAAADDIAAVAAVITRHFVEGYTVTSDWAFFHPEDAEALM